MGNFFYTVSRLALGPTQLPIKWVLGALSPMVKGPGYKADHSCPSSAEIKKAQSYTSTPLPSTHGLALSYTQGQLYPLPLPI